MSSASKQGDWVKSLSICVLILWGSYSLGSAADSSDEPSNRTTAQCGHWAVLRCCQLLGVPVDMRSVMKIMPPRDEGHSMWTVLKSLEKAGLSAVGMRATFDELTAGPYPVIAHVRPDHFIVVIGADDHYVSLFDGYGRRKVWTTKRFRDSWTNKLLKVERAARDAAISKLPPGASRAAPHIEFETLLLDKGEIRALGEGVDFIFPFRNAGGADLVIKKIKTDCSCMESIKPEEPIPPGGQGRITLKYNVNKEDGPFSYAGLVQTNDPVLPWIKLIVSGNTSKAVRVKPKYLDLGRIVSGETHTTICSVRYTGDIPLDIVKVECPAPGVELKWRVVTRSQVERRVPAVPASLSFLGKNRNVRALEISFTPTADGLGKIEDRVYIHTNIRGFEKIAVPVIADIVPPIILSPDVLFLGEITPQQVVEQTVILFSANEHPFKIIAVDTADTGLHSTFSTALTTRTTISFDGKIQDTVTINKRKVNIRIQLTDDKEHLSLELPIYAKQI